MELHLAGWTAEDLSELCGWLRGLDHPDNNKLRNVLGDCDGLRALLDRINWLKEISTKSNVVTGQAHFDSAWHQWLGPAVSRLLTALNEEDDEDDEPTQALNAVQGTPADPFAPDQSEPDDLPSIELTGVEQAGPQHTLKNRLAEAIGREIYRRSCPDLLRSAENILPRCIARGAWERTRDLVSGALIKGDIPLAEAGIEYLLCIECGVTAAESREIAFIDGEAVNRPLIDLAIGALRRPELRPHHSYSPDPEATKFWMPTGGNLLFPLSPTTVDLCKALLRLRSQAGHASDTTLLITPVVVTKESLIDPQVRTRPRASSLVEHTRSANRSTYRKRIAACLTQSLGPDAAQIAFGDSFGSSVAPTYYGAFEASEIANATAESNVGFSDLEGNEHPKPARTWMTAKLLEACSHTVGSRVRPQAGTIADAWALVGVDVESRRGRPKALRDATEWKRKRDALATHLMIATAHRPVASLATIRLTDFLPRHGLVVIGDKRCDPSRMTRLAATGWNFIGALETYVADLRRMASDLQADDEARDLARRILRGQAPLFSVAGSGTSEETLCVATLLRKLPPAWAERPNLHRHALDQALISARISPEHRYFQLGWLEGDVHAVSDLAPYPPIDLGHLLGEPIDQWLRSMGWLGGKKPANPDDILAGLPPMDFEELLTSHYRDTERRIHELKEALNERRNDVAPQVQRDLVAGINALPEQMNLVATADAAFPTRLRIDMRNPEGRRPELSRHHIDVMLARSQSHDREPIHAFMAARLLNKTLVEAHKRKQCSGCLPTVHHVSFRSVPSPFFRGIGVAESIAAQARYSIQEIASSTDTQSGWPMWKAHACLVAVMSHTPYRSASQAHQILLSCGGAQHSNEKPWLIRVPLDSGHAAITGDPALLLHRLRQESDWVESARALGSDPTNQLGRFAKAFLRDRVPPKASDSIAGKWLIGALQASGIVEMTGPERLIMNGSVTPATVTAERISALEDGMSIPNAIENGEIEDQGKDSDNRQNKDRKRASNDDDSRVRKLIWLFNADCQEKVNGEPLRHGDHRLPQLLPLVENLLATLSEDVSVPRLMLSYVRHLMTEGGPKSKGGMAPGSIYKVCHYIRPLLASIHPSRDLRDVTDGELTSAILSAIALSGNKNKPVVLVETRRFFAFITKSYLIAEPDWDLAFREAGVAVAGKDPAVISDAEVLSVFDNLLANLAPNALEGVDPIERRFRELQFAAALLLEASNVRPQSIHGLTLADFHFDDDVDTIHLRSSGEFARIKTMTSAGFVPLEGTPWEGHRSWLMAFVDSLRRKHHEDQWINVPLFHRPGASYRELFPQRLIMDRIGELIRWRTRQSRGRAYWLRKRGIGRRHHRAQSECASAWAVYRAMRVCGHATMVTPIGSYVGDPLIWLPLAHATSVGRDRKRLSALSGTTAGTLDQRWQRRIGAGKVEERAVSTMRIGLTLHLPPATWASVDLSEPPPHRPFVQGLTVEGVEQVMAALGTGATLSDIAESTGIDGISIGKISELCADLARRTRLDVASGDLSRPRWTSESIKLFKQMAKSPKGLGMVGSDWASCTRNRTPPGTIGLFEPEAAFRLKAWVEACGMTLRNVVQENMDEGFQVTQKGDPLYGGSRVLSWLLAVVWVASRLKECDHLGLGR
ncbi:MAG: hypothetical protein O9303_00005 [Silanimonas sp.]|nr:hypothetical protein [Silanimonas sp.]